MSEAIPAAMTAIEIREPGGPEVLVPAKRPVPEPAEGEVLIRTAAAGVNRPDVLQRLGGYPPPPGASTRSKPSRATAMEWIFTFSLYSGSQSRKFPGALRTPDGHFPKGFRCFLVFRVPTIVFFPWRAPRTGAIGWGHK